MSSRACFKLFLTLGDIAFEYQSSLHRNDKKHAATIRWEDRVIEDLILPKFGMFPIYCLNEADMIEHAKSLIITHPRRLDDNRLALAFRKVMSILYAYAVARGYHDHNPLIPMEMTVRDHEIGATEMRAIFREFESNQQMSQEIKDALLVILMSGQRAYQVENMRWSEINFQDATWLIPARRSSSEQQIMVPLPQDLLTLFRTRQENVRHPIWVFPNIFARKGKNKGVRERCKQIQDKYQTEPFGIPDLRMTVYKGLQRLNVPQHIISLLMGHDFSHRYGLFDHFDEKRAALDLWQNEIRNILRLTESVK